MTNNFIPSMGYPMSATDWQYYMNAYQFPYQSSYMVPFKGTAAAKQETNPEISNAELYGHKKPEPTRKSNTGGTTAAVIGFIGASSLIAASVMGKGKGMSKVGDGYKQMGQWIKGTFGKVFSKKNEGTANAVVSDASAAVAGTKNFAIGTINGKTVCTIPGRRKGINGFAGRDASGNPKYDSSTVTKALEALGYKGTDKKPDIAITKNGITRLNDGIKLEHYTFEYKNKTVTVVNNKIVQITDKSGKKLDFFKNPVGDEEKVVNAIKEEIKKFNNGENLDKLQNLKLTHTENGLIRIYKGKGNSVELIGASTNRFGKNDVTTQAFIIDNPSSKTVIDAFNKGELESLGIEYGELQKTVDSKKVTFIIKDDKVTAVKYGGKTYRKGDDEFTIMSPHFENVLKQDKKTFENAIFSEK